MKLFAITAALLASTIIFNAEAGTEKLPTQIHEISLAGLSPSASQKYAEILGRRESANCYPIRNEYGFTGRWQMGAADLLDTGYVTTTNNKALTGQVWTAKAKALGVTNLTDFLRNKNGVQDIQFIEYTNRNYASLKRLGVIRPGMSQREIAGWLAAAHLKGPGGAKALAKGADNFDANGTAASSYYKMMAEIDKLR